MAAKKEDPSRFELVSTRVTTVKGMMGVACVTAVLLDNETGVNYLYTSIGEGGGLTPLLDKDGKPVVTPNGKDPV